MDPYSGLSFLSKIGKSLELHYIVRMIGKKSKNHLLISGISS
ncbi:unknown [Prevotella sp. CAG:924]|nr:unknown [Prevotella sp. CAG:924]